ncbi:MAG: hypothetical protein ACSHX0_09555 [Akkermansiaceae bacterium]
MPHDPSRPQLEHQAPIPEALRIQLEKFKKSLWKIKITEAVLAGIFGLVFSFLIVFILDRFIETPQGVRLIILILGVSLFAIFAPYWIHRWVYGHRYEGQIARLIAQKFPHLGDRLLGAVELQDQSEEKDSLSPELRAAAMRDVAKDIAGRDLQQALPESKHRQWLATVAGIVLITILCLFNFPNAGNNALKRWILPLSDTPRYTFTQLDLSGFTPPEYVPYGEEFSLTVPLSKDSIRNPETARARYNNGSWIEATLQDQSYTFVVPAQRASGSLQIEADDAIHSIAIEPVIRPSAKSVRAAIVMPAYLERPDVSADLRSGFITVLEGSSISIQTNISRELQSAEAEIIAVSEPTLFDKPFDEKKPNEAQAPPTGKKLDLTVSKTQITSSPFLVENQALIVPFSWQDIYGLYSEKALKIKIENVQDQAPSSYIQGVNRQHIMLADETIRFDVICEDDYGIKASGISWADPSLQLPEDQVSEQELTLAKGSAMQTALNTPFSFSPANLDIQPQKLFLRSWVEDYKPERTRVYSEPVILYILTKDEHAQVLKNDFDKIVGEMEEVAREEQNLNDENQRLERKENNELLTEEGKEKLQEQKEAESENKQRMQKLAENMENLFKSSVRNGEIDKDTLQKMSKVLQSMKELAQEDLPQVEKKLQDAQQEKSSADKSKQDLQEAIEAQEKALRKMQQALKEANDAKKQFEASTFIARLKRASSEQNNVASTFISMIDEVIGSSFSELDPVEQRAIKTTHQQQKKTAADIRWIQEDLSHYYQRTQDEKHLKLAEQISSSGIDEALQLLTQQVAQNKSVTSIQTSKKWSAQLAEWAKELEGEKDGGGGGGDGGGGSQGNDDFEFMLKVMRMIQQEQDIRERTRALEDLQRTLQLDPEINTVPDIGPKPKVQTIEAPLNS